MEDLLRERLYMLVQGYSDCNDARYLKTDPTFKAMLVNTEFDTATIQTIRLHLFKVALRVHRSVRRLWFNVTSSFVYQDLFVQRHQKILAIQ